jgi:hypothetical protein
MIEGYLLEKKFLQVEKQDEVGEEAYDKGHAILNEFFKENLKNFLEKDLMPEGRRIIECCLDDGTLQEYSSFINSEPIITG